jgi:uncharacterized protein YggE
MKRFAAVLLFVAGCSGSATNAYAAEEVPPTVSVEGVASVAISQTASQTEADAAYHQGLAAAISDGNEKAELLATKTGVKVGAVQQIIERGGRIECVVTAAVGPLTQDEQYKGAQPDFGSVELSGSQFAPTPAEAPPSAVPARTAKPRKKKHAAKAKKAAAPVSCALSTQVTLSYLLA